jgi:hypothetical protein
MKTLAPVFAIIFAALLAVLASPAFEAQHEWCTMICMREIPLGTENAEADKQRGARCIGMCGSKEACEWVLTNAHKHKLRTVGGCVEREKQ